MSYPPSGSLFFVDSYGTQYSSQWETVDGLLDITCITSEPQVWGQTQKGSISNRSNVFREGVITVERQVIQPTSTGYIIIADGVSQYVDMIRVTWPCGQQPSDPFAIHLDSEVGDDVGLLVGNGSCWTDISDSSEPSVVWGTVGLAGTEAGSGQVLDWVNVWGLH